MIALIAPVLSKPELNPIINGSPIKVLFAFPFTYGPLVYFYTAAETGTLKHFTKKHVLHFIPFIVSLIILIIISADEHNRHYVGIEAPGSPGFFVPLDIPEVDYVDFPLFPPEHLIHTSSTLDIFYLRLSPLFIFISLISYTFLIIKHLNRIMEIIPEYYSYESYRLNMKWIEWITISFCVAYSVVALSIILGTGSWIRGSEMIPDIATLFFIFTFSLFALRQQPILSGNESDEPVGGALDDNFSETRSRRYEKSGLKEEEAETLLHILEDYMKSEKPYLDPDLSLEHISSNLNVPKHYLTQVINERINRNFFMFVNEYRVNEVKKRISDPSFHGHTVLRIAYDSGFNSKSTFNSVFKKLTNMTPSEYRQKVITKHL